MKKKLIILAAIPAIIAGISVAFLFWHSQSFNSSSVTPTPDTGVSSQMPSVQLSIGQYPIHKNITATTFWIGESASGNNAFISNSKSAWDENWQAHYGGVDDPSNRNGFYPAGFTPNENPFYFALPYNDFDSNGNRKANVAQVIYWANESSWSESQSMLKNHWVEITKNDKTVYAQWEDVGPFGENDSAYVFGNSFPKSQGNNNAGIDLSPAIRDYLGLNGEDAVDWQFVKEADVPTGPWKDIITTS